MTTEMTDLTIITLEELLDFLSKGSPLKEIVNSWKRQNNLVIPPTNQKEFRLLLDIISSNLAMELQVIFVKN